MQATTHDWTGGMEVLCSFGILAENSGHSGMRDKGPKDGLVWQEWDSDMWLGGNKVVASARKELRSLSARFLWRDSPGARFPLRKCVIHVPRPLIRPIPVTIFAPPAPEDLR